MYHGYNCIASPVVITMQGPPPMIKEQDIDKDHGNTETPSPYVPWNNSPLKKSQGIMYNRTWVIMISRQWGYFIHF